MTNALFIFRHCSKKILRCVRRDLFKEDARCYCSVKDSDGAKAKGQNFRDVILRKWISPSEEEARSMESLFPNAKEVVEELFKPFSTVPTEANIFPDVKTTKLARLDLYRSKLQLVWPVKTEIVGVHTSMETSVHYAYLRACHFLRTMGLVCTGSERAQVLDRQSVAGFLEHLAGMQTPALNNSTNFNLIQSIHQREDDNVYWLSTLQVHWPLSFSVTSESTSLDLAAHRTFMQAAAKLKALGFLDINNKFKTGVLIGLHRYDKAQEEFVIRNFLNPDYELYVDASGMGMGGYLLANDTEQIHWISDSWSNEQHGYNLVDADSNVNEMYAVVTAIYTWKHKFEDKKVRCHSDNILAVNLVNHGIYAIKWKKENSRIAMLLDLYLTLQEMCEKYRITLVGTHLPGKDNMAADLLSRCHVDKFKEMVPTARMSPKKSKKLWFRKHLKRRETKPLSEPSPEESTPGDENS
ncbi:uncharacterized protein LOC128218037 [Mya arenaria]|uniref:uncharacterized protein LOC128218037 n=1 Tax=Mya arenaria TaxID=6604 RepID=UPI0022E2A4E0|nr:uncharacterized protein LOC128218037 [Mya arenaria]